jgi:hypothetical protein
MGADAEQIFSSKTERLATELRYAELMTLFSLRGPLPGAGSDPHADVAGTRRLVLATTKVGSWRQ